MYALIRKLEALGPRFFVCSSTRRQRSEIAMISNYSTNEMSYLSLPPLTNVHKYPTKVDNKLNQGSNLISLHHYIWS